MKKILGNLRKMKTQLNEVVEYHMMMGEEPIPLNNMLGEKINLSFMGNIHCIQCQRKTNKSFQQGYCYPCMLRLNECGNCVIFPEKCRVEEGSCQNDDWAHAHCSSGQIIYLANASGLKVGVTRDSHIPTRWIDQGAIQAIPIFSASNRYRAGLMEMLLKSYVSDRTHWRMMLKNESLHLDLIAERDHLLKKAEKNLHDLLIESGDALQFISEANPIAIKYPVLEYPTKISTLSFDKQRNIEGILLGIKGQYLILDCGVLNIRKFGGYEITLFIKEGRREALGRF